MWVCVFVHVCAPACDCECVQPLRKVPTMKKKSKVLNVFWWWTGFSSLCFPLLFKWFSLFYFSNQGESACVWLLPSEKSGSQTLIYIFPRVTGRFKETPNSRVYKLWSAVHSWGIAHISTLEPGTSSTFGAQSPMVGPLAVSPSHPGPESGLRAASLSESSLSAPPKASGEGKTLPPLRLKAG